MATVLLLGLESDLADPLALILRRLSHDVSIANSIVAALRERRADIVFAGGDSPHYREIVKKITAECPGKPLILVNRFPENERWLDALELGAADYCGAPFEAVQIEWLLDGVMRGQPKALAA